MPSERRGIGEETVLNELGGARSRLARDPVEFFESLSGTYLPSLEALPKVVHRVLVVPHALPECLNLRQDARGRVDRFEGVCDVVKDVQVFDDRADLGLPHVAPPGRTGEKVAGSHDRGIRVCQAIHLRKDLILRSSRRLAERREEAR